MVNKIGFSPNTIHLLSKPKLAKGMLNGKHVSAQGEEEDVPPEAILAQMMFAEITEGSAQVISHATESMRFLPPEAQFERERQAILNDLRLKDLLDPSRITDMTRGANGTWTIMVDGKALIEVDVLRKPQPEGIVGPGEFDLDFQPLFTK